MEYKVDLSREALKFLDQLDADTAKQITRKIGDLARSEIGLDIKRLRGSQALFRLRSGKYRIIYRKYDGIRIIYVVDINHRKDVYRDL